MFGFQAAGNIVVILIPKVLLSLKLSEMPLPVNLQFESSLMLFNCIYWRNLISGKKVEKLF